LISKQAPGLPHEIVIEDIDEAVVVIIFGIGAHRETVEPLVVSHPKFQARFESTVALIQEEKIPFGVVGDKTSIQLSLLKSAMPIPIPLPGAFQNLTFCYVPNLLLPRL
jgi:hypothetical protein